MKTLEVRSSLLDLDVTAVKPAERELIVSVDSLGAGQTLGCACCPVCGTDSSSRHSSYVRVLQDLPAHGRPVRILARLTRWRCRNTGCDRRIFAEQLPNLAAPFARQTSRFAQIVKLFGHTVGGRPAERLMARLGMPVSDITILHSVKAGVKGPPEGAVLRVVGIDEWAWRKGRNFGTIIVNLERRKVVELLADRTATSTADWFKRHPGIEIVSRDRAGLYAEAARQGAPQARQVADRFHLLKNFRETVERQIGRFEAPIRQGAPQVDDDLDPPEQPAIERSDVCSEVAAHERLVRRERDASRQALFDEIRALYDAGGTVTEIARQLGIGRRRVYRWVRRIDVPEHSIMEPKLSTPAYFGAFLARSWAEGTTKVRHLFSDIRHRGYTGSFSHLARFVSPWRSCSTSGEAAEPASLDQEAVAAPRVRTLDPMTGRQISAPTAAELCVKPRGQMSARQVVNVDALKAASPEFTTMRKLAMRFQGLLRGGKVEPLATWLEDARQSGIFGMRRFARTLRQDIEAVRNAILEPWSNGQTEGQINRLKTLKRAMYGRAGVDLLRARMMPLQT